MANHEDGNAWRERVAAEGNSSRTPGRLEFLPDWKKGTQVMGGRIQTLPKPPVHHNTFLLRFLRGALI